jgi:cytochrome c553
VALVLVVPAAPVASAPSSRVAWTLATVEFARSGDAARGKTLHKDCADCHGPAGVVDTPDVPNLAGQDLLYVFKQLQDYKASSRTSPIMNEAVASLSERDMADLAAFYAAQKPLRPARAPAKTSAAVVRLVSTGDGARLMPACDACHGDRGSGNAGFYGMPSLQSQKPDDLALQLTSFRSGERANDVYRVMRDISQRLSDAEIAALAAYYGAPPSPPSAASSGKQAGDKKK